jgi:curved DNA-binding protein CbpA
MASSAKTLCNHYETLNVRPTASKNDILEAFAAQMRTARLRPEISVARLAQLSVAFETLSDPMKRRAYDLSLGLARNAPSRTGEHRIVFARGANIGPGSFASDGPSFEPARENQSEPAAALESRLAGFIAESVREPARKAEVESPSPAASSPRGNWQPQSSLEPLLVRLEERRAISNEKSRSVPPYVGPLAVALVAGVLATAFFVTGTHAPLSPREQGQAQSAVTVSLPPADPANNPAVASVTPAPDFAPATAEAKKVAANASPVQHSTRRGSADGALARGNKEAAEAQPLHNVGEGDSSSDAASAENNPVESGLAPAAAAKMPLPDTTIASTIERIGYSCGRVVSTSRSEGAAQGVYTVTCSSGQSYRASPVNGRYHFRRMSAG